MKTRRTLLGSALVARIIFGLMLPVLLATNGNAQNSVDMRITPAVTNVQINQTFAVSVLVDFGTGSAAAVDAYLNFNPLDLEVVSTPTVPAMTQAGLPNESVPFAAVATMNAAGRVDHGRFTLSGAGHLNADFNLFTVTFRALRIPPGGNTTISFNTAIPRETAAGEFGQPDILNSTFDGVVNISSCSPPSATISSNSGSAICNGQPVTISLASATGASPYDLTINGTTYNDVTVGSSITTVPFPTYSVFTPSTVPSNTTSQNDGFPITNGVKFTSSQAGFIKGIRFYAGTITAGTYRAKLRPYNAPNTLLADEVFTTVTPNSWNEIIFPTAVPITANTVYVAMIHSTAGYYVATDNYFTSAVTNGPLTFPANGTPGSGPNSVYFYGTNAAADATFSGSGFTGWLNYNASNYYIDVVFTSNTNTFNLTTVNDNNGCSINGAPNLQSLVVTSVDCSTLPVTLLNLSATPEGNKAIIRWTTTQEINNRGFHVERSTDNSAWTSIGFVTGVGNTDNPTNYSFTDFNLESRRYFYRLKQVDFDDRFKYSATVSALIGSRSEYSLGQNYPNPFNNQTTIQYVLPQRENVLLTLHDANGKLIKVLTSGTKDAGTHAINVNSGTLSRGVYYYKIVAGEFINMKKMVVQ